MPNINITEDSIGIWFSQGYSSQRDLVLTAQELLRILKNQGIEQKFHIIASHEQRRPEITDSADIVLQEPKQNKIDWVIEQAKKYQVKLLIAGQNTKQFIQAKARFAEHGITVLAGMNDIEKLNQINDKSLFTEICQSQNIDVVAASTVHNHEEMQLAYEYWAKQGEVCVKPTQGVFASGFWILDPQASPFAAFANSQNFRVHPQTFIDSYAKLDNPPAYLVMPFLEALECSVDMFCINGRIQSAVARYKHEGDYQSLHLDDPAIDLAREVVNLFGCDGLVNLQARYNDKGQLYVLEINARASGGIGYTFLSGHNIVQHAICHYLDLPYQSYGDEQNEIIMRAVSLPLIV
ncbi:ATP-grasp domain-containing protein [Acinetobacter sp. c1-l78]